MGVCLGFTGLWLARNEGRDPYSSPYKTHYSTLRSLVHSFIPSLPKVSLGLQVIHWTANWLAVEELKLSCSIMGT